MSCCDYGEFYENENLMPPLHDCPSVAPLVLEDEEFYRTPLTPLEVELTRSLNLVFGMARGEIADIRRWS